MHERWLIDSDQIIFELIKLVTGKNNLYVYTEDEPDGLITRATHVCGYDGEDYLLLLSDGGLQTGQRGFVIYREPDEELGRGFAMEIKGSTANQVAVSLPAEIFQIQRRRHPRISTPASSEVQFYLLDEQIRHTLQVEDISRISARVSGQPRQELAVGSRLEGLSFALKRELYDNRPYAIQLRYAQVLKVKASPHNPTQQELVLSFQPSPVEHEQLELYIESRLWESALDKMKSKEPE